MDVDLGDQNGLASFFLEGGGIFFFFFHGSHYWQPPVWRFPPIRTATTFSQAFKSLLVHLSSVWRGGAESPRNLELQ